MMRSAKKDPLKWVKVVVLGNGAVGKSGSLEFFCCLVYHCGRYGGLNVVFLLSRIALTVRYLTNRFIHDYDPTFGELLRADKTPRIPVPLFSSYHNYRVFFHIFRGRI